ncbi:MAG TPA: AraC family transcriptional regulator [Actinocrinis sp.]|nr:AraC family transcriptional regulator [Actinocrinis sp.]
MAASQAGDSARVKAWRPAVRGVAEVFHAHFTDHVYPLHAHESWTLLIVDYGAVHYDLDRHAYDAPTEVVTLLPPYVPHNGQSATPHGFRKRVLYLDEDLLGDDLIGTAVDTPVFADPLLRRGIDHTHHALQHPGDELEAESLLALTVDRIRRHLLRTDPVPQRADAPDPATAHLLRDLLNARVVEGLSLGQAAAVLQRHPTHLVRAFRREFGMPPHQYLTSRRVDQARGLLLSGMPVAEAAVGSGFYDQAHLTRHFKRILGANPGGFKRTAGVGRAAEPPRV